MLASYITMVHGSHLYYSLNYRLYAKFCIFPLTSLFLFQDPFFIQLRCLHGLLSFSVFFWLSWPWLVKSTGQTFSRMFLQFGLSWSFLTISMRLWIWGKNTIQVMCLLHHSISGGLWLIVSDVNLNHVGWCLAGFSTIKLIYFFFWSYSISQKQVTKSRPQSWEWELNFTS